MTTLLSRVLSAAVLAASLASPAFAQSNAGNAGANKPIRVASVDAKRILEESAPAKAAYDKIAAEFQPREDALKASSAKLKQASDDFERNSATMSDSDRAARQKALSDMDRAFQRDQRSFSEDLNARKGQELQTLLDLTGRAIRKIAEAGGYDIVVQDAYFASPKVDITNQVIKELANPAGLPPAAPKP